MLARKSVASSRNVRADRPRLVRFFLMDLRTALGWAYLASPLIVFFVLFMWVMLRPPKSWADRTPAARARLRAEAAARKATAMHTPSSIPPRV
jgi:hypothetical protein